MTIWLVRILLCLVIAAFVPTPGFCVEQKVLQEGGPNVSDSPSIVHKFTTAISVPKASLGKPIWITFYNGYGAKPGFNWVRVILSPQGQAGSQIGEVLTNEHTFLHKNALTVDLAGRMSANGNQLNIEAQGPKGASFSWVLTTVKEDFMVIESNTITPGKTSLIHGIGFSTNKEENVVTIGGKKAEVLEASDRILSVKVPDDIEKPQGETGTIPITVSVGGRISEPIKAPFGFLPPHLLSMSPFGGPAGGTLNIRGVNFSREPSMNVVMIGPYNAPVLEANEGELLVQIPNWGDSGGTLPVRVTSNGVPSNNQLRFWCIAHYYGGDPNAAIYHYD